MKTVVEILQLSCLFLQKQGVENPRRDVERILAMSLSLKRLDLYLQYDRPLSDSELESVRAGVRRLASHEPIQHIEGKVPFYNCVVSVNTHVLIPRPETEVLVEMVARFLKGKELAGMKILDLCAGSGCIGIAVKKEFPDFKVLLVDSCPEALAMAHQNAIDNGVDVEILQSDLFANLQGRRFDCIISNPPYVSESEYACLDKCVQLFEPRQALLAGNSGLEFYRVIAESVHPFLEKNGSVFLEIGAQQNEAVRLLFEKNGFTHIVSTKDFSDRDRFLAIFQ